MAVLHHLQEVEARVTTHSRQTSQRRKLLESCHADGFREELKGLAAARGIEFEIEMSSIQLLKNVFILT